MRRLLYVVLLVFVSNVAMGREVRDSEHLYALCTVCHGSGGQGKIDVKAPKIARLPSFYVATQLIKFRDGIRGSDPDDTAGQQMAKVVSSDFTDDEIVSLAGFISKFPDVGTLVTITGNEQSGMALYSVCASCHGLKAEGMSSIGAPPLAGYSDWYLVEQIRKFKKGLRGKHPMESSQAKAMALWSKTMPNDRDIESVVAYINLLGESKSIK